MLKMRDLCEVPVLFELLSDPAVYPYVRQRTNSSDEYYFVTKQLIEAEENGKAISRTIVDEYYQPIGTINLFDIQENYGFLATWIGKPYFGKGYNQNAKALFFNELFFERQIETIFIKIRKTNIRSLQAILKLAYVAKGNHLYPEVFQHINKTDHIYELFFISKAHYLAYLQFHSPEVTTVPSDGEGVS